MRKNRFASIAFIVFAVVVTVAFFYFDRHNAISSVVKSYGTTGVIAAVLAMGVVCMTPIPAEGMLIAYIKVYGVAWGVAYSWMGFVLGSIAMFAFARWVGRQVVTGLISGHRISLVDVWVGRKGVLGLLIVRLLPIPAFLTNCMVGLMPSISFWTYLWTGAVTIIPYYVAVAFLVSGFYQMDYVTIAVALLVLILIGIASYRLKRRPVPAPAQKEERTYPR